MITTSRTSWSVDPNTGRPLRDLTEKMPADWYDEYWPKGDVEANSETKSQERYRRNWHPVQR